MTHEHRTRTRVNVGKFTAVVRTGEEEMTVQVANISLKGMLFLSCGGLSEGNECTVRLELSPDAFIEVESEVIRVDDCNTAVDFKAIAPDSFGHLRRLVQFHADNPDAIDDEISTPAFK